MSLCKMHLLFVSHPSVKILRVQRLRGCLLKGHMSQGVVAMTTQMLTSYLLSTLVEMNQKLNTG